MEPTTYSLELTAAELKVTWSALKSLMNDFGHDEKEVHDLIRRVLAKLPPDSEVSTIDISAELAKRRSQAA